MLPSVSRAPWFRRTLIASGRPTCILVDSCCGRLPGDVPYKVGNTGLLKRHRKKNLTNVSVATLTSVKKTTFSSIVALQIHNTSNNAQLNC